MNAPARSIALALGGRRAQRLADGSYLMPCPVPSHGKGRGDRKPSLRIGDGETRVLVHCYSGCDRLDVLDELRRRGLLDGPRAGGQRAPARTAVKRTPAPDNKSALALAIWDEARDPAGTPVIRHLSNRKVILPPRCNAIRFHARCPFGKDASGATIYTPAMLALVVGILDDKPQAIHRTALDLDGNQIEIAGCKRMTLGPIAAGAVKLTPDADVTIALGIGEGLETTLSLQKLPEWAGSPVWSLLSRNGIASFPLLAGIETLAVSVDHDAPGEKAAREVTERWHHDGREVLLFEAVVPKADLNNVVME